MRSIQFRPWLLVASLLTAIPAALIILASIGGLTETNLLGIPIVPWYTLIGLPTVLIIRDIAMACTLGFALIGGVLSETPNQLLGKLASMSALVWLGTLLLQIPLTVSEVLALRIQESFDPTIIQSLLTQTTTGRVIIAQLVIVTIVALLAWVVLGRVTGWIVVGLAAVAAFLPGLTGHSSMSGGHNSASIALGVHLVAMGMWVGGLVAIAWYVKSATTVQAKIITRFSAIALVSVILIAESGLLNASMRIDGIAPYLTSIYGSIVLAKIAILILLIGFGYRQRKSLAESTNPRLIKLAMVELLWMGVVIGLAVALSRTAAPAVALDNDPADLGSLAVVMFALPAAVVFAFPVCVNRLRIGLLGSYPEVLAIALVVALFAANEFLGSGVLAGVVGSQLAALLIGVCLFAVGLIFIANQYVKPSALSLSIVYIGWLTVSYWHVRQLDQSMGLGLVFISLLILGFFIYLVARVKQPSQKKSVSALVEVKS